MKETLELKEELASQVHFMWADWMLYVFSKCTTNNAGEALIPVWAVERWQRQIHTHYEKLTEEEKESDRAEAEKILAIVFGRDT